MNNSFRQIQETKFSQFYLDNCEKQLKQLKTKTEEIKHEYTNFLSYIKKEILSSDIIDFFNNKIDEFQSWIKAIKAKENYKKDFRIKEIKDNNIIDSFYDFINLYQNEYLKNINKLIEDINNIYQDIIMSFDPQKINNSADKIIDIQILDDNGKILEKKKI